MRRYENGEKIEDTFGKLSEAERNWIRKVIGRCNSTLNGELEFEILIECLCDAPRIASYSFDLDAAMSDGWLPKA